MRSITDSVNQQTSYTGSVEYKVKEYNLQYKKKTLDRPHRPNQKGRNNFYNRRIVGGLDWLPLFYSLTKTDSIGTDEMKVTNIYSCQNRR